jgi:hypothetical protein
MLLDANEVARSLRGTTALIQRRPEGIREFDISLHGFLRSFSAILLTLPAFVVLTQAMGHRTGADPHPVLLSDPAVTVMAALAHVGMFLAAALTMIPVARRLGLTDRYVPFVVAANWAAAVKITLYALPQLLLVIDWATPGLASLFTTAVAVVALNLLFVIARVTLQVGPWLALGIAGGLLMLDAAIAKALAMAVGV